MSQACVYTPPLPLEPLSPTPRLPVVTEHQAELPEPSGSFPLASVLYTAVPMAGYGTGHQTPTPPMWVIFNHHSATLPNEWLRPPVTNFKISEMWRALWEQGIECMEEPQTMYVFMYVCMYFWWSNKIFTEKSIPSYSSFYMFFLYSSSYSSYRTSLVAQLVKNLSAMWETWVQSWRRERLPNPVFWPGEFHGLCRVGYDWVTFPSYSSMEFLIVVKYT